jgi:hypothetical protein
LKYCKGHGQIFAPFSWIHLTRDSAFVKAILFVASLPRKSAGRFTANSVKRSELEHVIRAAGSIANERELIILGSQAILGAFPNPLAELTVSQEVDIYPLLNPANADLIDGSIGEKFPFHETFGYYGLFERALKAGTFCRR